MGVYFINYLKNAQMMKLRVTIKEFINTAIKIGDQVLLIDGSALTLAGYDEDIYIIYAYPEFTGSESILKDIICTVVNVNVEAYCAGCKFPDVERVYRQDLVLKCGDTLLRTASGMVRKVDVYTELESQAAAILNEIHNKSTFEQKLSRINKIFND